ncbi:transposase [Methanocaldococcus sp. 28A]
MSALLTFTYVIIDNLLKQPTNKIYIADSAGVSINRLYSECIYRGKRTKRRVFGKLHILACYYPNYGYIPVVAARWGTNYSSDSANLLEMLKQIDFLDIEYLLADSGYDCCELFEYSLNHNISPIVKTKEFKWDYKTNKVRKRIKGMFNQNLYRYRGVVESIFGGLETKNRLKLNDRLLNIRRNSTIAAAIVHNILILMRLSVLIHNTSYSS